MNEQDRSMHERRRQFTAISVEEFNPELNIQPIPYIEGEQITRANLTSWLIRGFAISRGDIAIQCGYLRWASAQIGFDYPTSIRNFMAIGIELSLSVAERDMIEDAYKGIKRHSKVDLDYKNRGVRTNSPVLDFAWIVQETKARSNWEDRLKVDFPDINDFENLTKEEFNKWAQEKYQQRKNELKDSNS